MHNSGINNYYIEAYDNIVTSTCVVIYMLCNNNISLSCLKMSKIDMCRWGILVLMPIMCGDSNVANGIVNLLYTRSKIIRAAC